MPVSNSLNAVVHPPRRRRLPFLGTIARMIALHRQRQQLAALDDHLLRDIGLTRTDVERETARPFWDAPSHWRY